MLTTQVGRRISHLPLVLAFVVVVVWLSIPSTLLAGFLAAIVFVLGLLLALLLLI